MASMCRSHSDDPKIFRIAKFHQHLPTDAAGRAFTGDLSIFAASGANILTINQSIPTSGAAMVTISAETTDLVCSVEELLKEISAENGVVKAEIVAG